MSDSLATLIAIRRVQAVAEEVRVLVDTIQHPDVQKAFARAANARRSAAEIGLAPGRDLYDDVGVLRQHLEEAEAVLHDATTSARLVLEAVL